MHFWNNQSEVPKEAFSWRCIDFSDFFHFLEKVFWLQFTKKIREWFMNLCLLLLIGSLEGKIPSFSRFTLSSNFWGIMIRNCFSKIAKITEISASTENCFFGNKTQVILKGYLKTSEAYFIKWTTSDEPPVCLRSHQGSKWSHSKAVL